MKLYKGFTKDLKCRDFQYEIGKEYHEESADLCHAGFHACENPLDTFRYYAPGSSRYCEVELDEVSDQRDSDTKRAAKKIKIGAEIGLKGVIDAGVKFIFEKCEDATEERASGERGNAAASGERGNAAASGNSGNAAASGWSGNAAASGWRGNAAASGNSGNAAASGDRGNAAASGDSGNAAASGWSGNAAASGWSGNAAASGNSGNAAASGLRGNAAASGWSGNAAASGWSGNAAASGVRGCAVSSGKYGSAEANGKQCIAVAFGEQGRARGKIGNWIVVAEYGSDGEIIEPKIAVVDGENIKQDTWYTVKNGEFVEVEV